MIKEYSVVLPCAGIGSRMGLGYNKLLYQFSNGKTVIETTLEVFIKDDLCKEIVVVVGKQDKEVMKQFLISDKMKMTIGGKTRQESVHNGLKEVTYPYVFIHDGARPYLSQDRIQALLETLETKDACLLMVPAKDTIKKVVDGVVIETLNRAELYQAQTPQAFKTALVLEAYNKAKEVNFEGTDDASLVENMLSYPVYFVLGDYNNIKITTIEDIKE